MIPWALSSVIHASTSGISLAKSRAPETREWRADYTMQVELAKGLGKSYLARKGAGIRDRFAITGDEGHLSRPT